MRLKKTNVGPVGRLRAGLPAGATAGIVVFGLLAGGLALVFQPGLYVLGSAVIPSILVGLRFAWNKGKGTNIPPLFLDELSEEQNYTCQPCTAANLKAATEMVRPWFGRESIDVEKIEQWRLKNPQGFMEIVDSAGDLIACFVVIGLVNSFMQQFAEGRLTEQDIDGECVLDMRNTKKQPEIYISGVMVKDSKSFVRAVHARYLIWSMLMYLKHHFRPQGGRRFYAVALTGESERLLKGLGFSIASPAMNRKDKHDFYSLNVDLDTWKKLLYLNGDFRIGCKMQYQRK